LQGGDAKPQGADILTKKTGAHFFIIPLSCENEACGKTLPKTAEKMITFL
jgi:hypothetical protein